MRVFFESQTSPPRGDHGPSAPAAPGQLDLFQDRYLGLQRARDLLASGQLDSARQRYDEMRARYPHDTTITREAEMLAGLITRMEGLAAASIDDRAVAMCRMADELGGASATRAVLRAWLLERVARELEAARGPETTLLGRVPGHYLLEAGAVERARESLERALARTRSAPVLLAWADLLMDSGQPERARAIYLEALVRNPYAGALDRVRDADIAALPDVALSELDIADEPRAWCAPVGMVMGVLPSVPGERLRQALDSPPEPGEDHQPGARAPERALALERARQFVRALQDATTCHGRDDLMAARRTMKRLQPALFRVYLGQEP